jgi:5-methylcytosine-specific restriction endonuclease McrA
MVGMNSTKDWFEVTADSKHIAKEREKARKLKKSQWWLDKLNQGICHYCGGKFTPSQLTMDHIVPVARGGTSTQGNIVPACKSCNASKKLETPAEMLLKKLREP